MFRFSTTPGVRLAAMARHIGHHLRKLCIPLALICAALTIRPAAAATVKYDLHHLGGNEFTIAYVIAAAGNDLPIHEFSIYFDPLRYADLRLAASPAGWDSLMLQPEPALGSSGMFDSLALSSPLAAGRSQDGFMVAFQWIGAGQPGAQRFEVVNPADLSVVGFGYTSPVAAVPEPGAPALLIAGLALLGARAARSHAARSKHGAAIHAGGAMMLAALALGAMRPAAAQAPPSGAGVQFGVLAAAPPSVRIERMTKLAEQRIGRTLFRYHYLVEVRNDGAPLTNVRVQLTASGDGGTVLSGIVPVGDLGTGASAATRQDIVFTHDRAKPFVSTELRWRVIADPTGALARLDPGPALAGVDADANGIRDDVEAAIAELIPDQAIAVPALRVASALQLEILARTADESLQAQVKFEKSLACLVSRSADFYQIFQTVSVITFNTRERLEAYVRHKSSLPPNRDVDLSGTCEPEINDEN